MDPNLSNPNNQGSSPHIVVPAPGIQGNGLPPLPNAPQPAPTEPTVFSQTPVSDKPLTSNSKDGYDDLPKQKTISKKTAALLMGLFVVIALPLTVVVSQRQQTTQSGAANPLGPETVIAVINGQNVLEKDLEVVAAEQYDPDSIDNAALKDALLIIEERKILDLEKTQKNIIITDEEIAVKEGDGFDAKSAYYEVLKDKVTLIEAKNWEVYTIGFWVPPTDERGDLTAAEKKLVQQRLADGLKALDTARDQLATSKSALDIARDLVKKYPSLAPVLGVNGYMLKDLTGNADLSDVQNPRTYTYETSNKGQALFDAIYSLKTPGQIKKAISELSSGGNVVKLVKSNSTAKYNTYEAWLAAKKATLVNVTYSL